MRRACAVLLLAALPAAAGAAEVPVQTGEHDGFTRIAIDFPAAPDWELAAPGRVWRLSTDGAAAFDLSGIHRRIGRDRIRDITQPAPGRIDIHVACDCAPRTFAFGESGLVIDVRDREPGMAERAAPPARLIRDLARDLPLPERPSASPPGAETGTAPKTPPRDRVEALKADVLAGLSRSAERGIVDLRRRLPAEPPAAPPDPAPVLPAPRLDPGTNMRVETRAERDRRGTSPLPAGAACPAALSEDRAAWLARPREVGADAPPAVRARAEAMGLIARGLGAEAAARLRPHLDADGDAALLYQIAGIVDAPAPAPALAALVECSPLLALFALLADPPAAPADADPLIAALHQFDGALRLQFGRRVMAALGDLGRAEEARRVENALRRLDPALAPGALADRRFGPGRREASPAEAMAEMADRSPEAAAALQSLIAGMRRRGEEVPASVIDHAAALAPELAPGERAGLLRAVIRAEIAQLHLASAARRIRGLARLDSDRAAALEAQLYAALAEIPDDAVFLQQAARFASRPAPEAAQRIALSRRIAALHVPALARDHLAPETGAPAEAERLLGAELSLELGEPERALAVLGELRGAEADRLRAEARTRLAPPPAAAAPAAETGPLAVIERSAALRAKYRSLLSER